MTRKKVLIACGIFADELKAVVKPDEHIEIRWIEAALHADAQELKHILTATLSQCAAEDQDTYVLFGRCHPDIDELCGRYGAKRMEADNCIHAFLGASREQREQDRTMVMTPGWIREWRSIMDSQGWDEVDARISLGRYRRILLLDPGLHSLSDDEILAFFDLIQVPIELEPLDLTVFRQTINRIMPGGY